MQNTRSATAFILVGATVVALALGGAAVASASDGPTNRGWNAPVGQADEFAQTSDD